MNIELVRRYWTVFGRCYYAEVSIDGVVVGFRTHPSNSRVAIDTEWQSLPDVAAARSKLAELETAGHAITQKGYSIWTGPDIPELRETNPHPDSHAKVFP